MISTPRREAAVMLNRRRLLQLAGVSGAGLMLAACGGGDDRPYPSDQIEYMIPYNPGGSTDPIGREFSSMVAKKLGTTATPLNRPGGDESIGITHVYRAEPTGYELGMCSSAGMLGQPQLNPTLQYKGREDLTPIIKMVDVPYALLVAGDSELESLEDFVEAAKREPKGLRVSSPNRMGGSALTLYALEESAGIKTTLVPSTGGSGEAALAVMGGRVTAMIGTGAGQRGLVEAGDMRALAYTGSTRYGKYLPDAVSFEEAGYDVPFSGDYMTFGPKGMPTDRVEKIRQAAVEVAESKEWADWCENQSILPDRLAGTELTDWLDSQGGAIEKAVKLGQQALT